MIYILHELWDDDAKFLGVTSCSCALREGTQYWNLQCDCLILFLQSGGVTLHRLLAGEIDNINVCELMESFIIHTLLVLVLSAEAEGLLPRWRQSYQLCSIEEMQIMVSGHGDLHI